MTVKATLFRKRRAIMFQILVFLAGIFIVGLVMIIFDRVLNGPSGALNWAQQWPSGIYDQNVISFFNYGWSFLPIIVLATFSVWLLLRGQDHL